MAGEAWLGSVVAVRKGKLWQARMGVLCSGEEQIGVPRNGRRGKV